MNAPIATSSRCPTFPFGIERSETYSRDPDVRSLPSAALSGDVSVIDRVEERFGGARYDDRVAQNAIEAGNLAFFEKYLLLCRWHLILTDVDPDEDNIVNWFWVYYLRPFDSARSARADDDTRYKAVRIVVEKFLPCLPEHDEIVHLENRLQRRRQDLHLPEFRDTIWSLDQFHTLVNDYHGRLLMSTFKSVANEEIYRYLAEEVGLKFDCDALNWWSIKFNPRIYQFVLDHLDPSIDKNSLPDDCLYHQEPPNDADFFDFIMECLCRSERNGCSTDPHVIEFLKHHPQFIPKIPSLMRELQNVNPELLFLTTERTPHAIYTAVLNPGLIPDIFRFLEQIRNQIPNAVDEEPFDIYCGKLSRCLYEDQDWFRNCDQKDDFDGHRSNHTEANDDEDDYSEDAHVLDDER